MTRRNVKLSVLFATFVLALVVLERVSPSPHRSALPPPVSAATSTDVHVTSTVALTDQPVTTTNAFVVRHVDGDTIIVRFDGKSEETKIRLLGVNTPETVDPRRPVECFGKEASQFTDSMVTGKRIRLDADPLADDVDKYGRLLRNVILEDGTDFDAQLVSQGYAYAYISFPLNPARKAQLRRLQNEAQAAQRGLWNPKTCNGQK